MKSYINIIALVLMVGSAIADSVLTMNNVNRYGIELEGNSLLRWSMEYFGIIWGLLLPKIVAIGLVIYTTKENKFIKGYLYIVATIIWSIGAFSNYIVK